MRRATIVSETHADGAWMLATRACAPAVAPYITQYVGYTEESAGAVRRLHVPHPHLTVIINLGAPLDIGVPAQRAGGVRYDSFVAGLFETAVVTGNTGPSAGIEMTVSPLRLWRLLGVPMSELSNHIVALDDVPGVNAALLVEQLRHKPSWDDRFDLLDRVLARRLQRRTAPSPEIAWVWTQLTQASCAHPVAAVTRELQWSRRRLNEVCRHYIGLSPKALARVARFDRVVRDVRAGNGTAHWSALAWAHGYADQAHLTREFREFAGVTPTNFARRFGAGIAGVAAD